MERVIQDGTEIFYQYDGCGHRVKKQVRDLNIKYEDWNHAAVSGIDDFDFIIDFTRKDHNIIHEDSEGNSQSYVWEPQSHHIAGLIKNEKSYFYQDDNLGSPVRLLDQRGAAVASYSYDEFGNRNVCTFGFAINQNFGFAGYYRDEETSFYHTERRYYNSQMGLFFGNDLIKGNTAEPLTLHPYLFCWNNPLIYTDLDGAYPGAYTDSEGVEADLYLKAYFWWYYTVLTASSSTPYPNAKIPGGSLVPGAEYGYWYANERKKMEQCILIENIIGKVLKNKGFSCFQKTGSNCGFIRKIQNNKDETIKQMISFYNNKANTQIIMDLRTSAAGYSIYRINQYVPGCTEYALHFSNDEEYLAAIEKYAEILQKYGIPQLEDMKEPLIFDYISDKDYKRFYNEHEQILENFIQREEIRPEQMDAKQVVEFIELRLLKAKDEPFDIIRELILEMSALFGAVVKQYTSCKWVLEEFDVTTCCVLEFPPTRLNRHDVNIIGILSMALISKRRETDLKKELLSEYNRIILPATEDAQM